MVHAFTWFLPLQVEQDFSLLLPDNEAKFLEQWLAKYGGGHCHTWKGREQPAETTTTSLLKLLAPSVRNSGCLFVRDNQIMHRTT